MSGRLGPFIRFKKGERTRLLMMKKIASGDSVLFFAKGKSWLVRIQEGNDFHTHLGRIRSKDVIGLPFGSAVVTEKGEKVYALKPTFEDFIMKCDRQTQIIYPKDLGLISLEADIGPGCKVIETGSGSGALTMYLASLVRPKGRVYSYEIREDFIRIAERNVRKAGLDPYVTFYNVDASRGFKERNVDAAVIDLGDPWNFVENCWRSLKPSGHFVGVTPTMNQAETLSEALRKGGFDRVKCIEVLLRNIEARAGRSRPSTMMIGHTTYLVFGTKVLEKTPG
jgi:tRNA (adenine57-N1/adenine58-N1)-methyltransferase